MASSVCTGLGRWDSAYPRAAQQKTPMRTADLAAGGFSFFTVTSRQRSGARRTTESRREALRVLNYALDCRLEGRSCERTSARTSCRSGSSPATLHSPASGSWSRKAASVNLAWHGDKAELVRTQCLIENGLAKAQRDQARQSCGRCDVCGYSGISQLSGSAAGGLHYVETPTSQAEATHCNSSSTASSTRPSVSAA